MNNEIWKNVDNLPEKYLVSNFGRLKNKTTGRILKTPPNKIGYSHFNSSVKQFRQYYYVHILVAKAFLGDCPDGFEINHKDHNKENNHVDNLEYVSHKDNIHKAIKLYKKWCGRDTKNVL